MAAGHLTLAFDSTFLVALLLLITGAGFVRGNVAPQIGELYSPEDRRRASPFRSMAASSTSEPLSRHW